MTHREDIFDLYYPLVSEAIHRAEDLEDRGAPSASEAYSEVSRLEEKIADHLPASDPEGELARRGAVRAALSAGDEERARHLLERYLDEPGLSEGQRKSLGELGAKLTAPTDTAGQHSEILSLGPLAIHFERHEVRRGGEVIDLSKMESDLLHILADRRNESVSAETLVEYLLDKERSRLTRTVEAQIAKLRQKIEQDPSHPRHLVSVDQGYKLVG